MSVFNFLNPKACNNANFYPFLFHFFNFTPCDTCMQIYLSKFDGNVFQALAHFSSISYILTKP